MKSEFIPITKPFFTQDEIRLVQKAIKSGWVSQGQLVSEFEEEIAKITHARYSVATTSCTTALHLALLCLNIGPGDEVIVPSYTFIATANVILHGGAKPVFVDIDPRTYNISPEQINYAITKRTKAIIPVHQVGLPCDMDEINAIAKRKNIEVIQDAACALGSEYKAKPIGSIGRLTCFSFHPRKILTTGEGGMLVTSDATIANKARRMRNHGASISAFSRHNANKVIFEKYSLLGFNYRMTDIQAAIGLAQCKKINWILERRRFLAKRYIEAFSDSEFFEMPYEPKYAKHNFQSFIIRLKIDSPRLIRDRLIAYLLKRGIATRRGIMAIHTEPYYRKRFGHIRLTVTEEMSDSTMIIPLFPQMQTFQQRRVIDELKSGLRELLKKR